MRWTPLVAVVAAVVTLYAVAPPAEARSKLYKDDVRGFRLKIPDSFEQVPPKLTGPTAHLAGEWFDDKAKYGRSRPEFTMTWFATPTNVPPPPPGTEDESGEEKPDEELSREELIEKYRPKSFDDVVDGLLERNERLFGAYVPMAERWAKAKSVKETKTAAKIKARYVELNKKKKSKKGPPWYLLAAKLTFEQPDADIEVGFLAYCDRQYVKKLPKEFLAIVRSFKLREIDEASPFDDWNQGGDPEAFVQHVIDTKVIPGWDYYRTPEKHYLLLYDKDVKRDLVKAVGKHIEAIREQVYEKIFPSDKEITAVSVVRVCEDRNQYFAYGGPPGSAGYWSPPAKELVFFEMQGNRDDSLAVLYHEAFHQYIFYSVGDFSPHSWFNEGHGDFFAGHVYKAGKFRLKEFAWRKDLAKRTKRDGKAPPLKEWLRWDQREYYGRNEPGIAAGVNYALGWDFIYFLRTTRNEEYQKILPRYFNTLKGFVTQDREAREKALGDALDGGEKPKGGESGEEPAAPEAAAPKEGETTDVVPKEQWHDKAVDAAFYGIDLAQLEKDWLDS